MKKKHKRKLVSGLVAGFALANLVAAFHAYKFTHFSKTPAKADGDAPLSVADKLKTLFTGVDNPRPVNEKSPTLPYSTITLQSNKAIECWLIERPSAKGTVILFHGFSGEKSSLIDRSEIFHAMGYNSLLVDFMGSGGSEGNQTTIGYLEAQQVMTAIEYVQARGNGNVILFGKSMGAVAIMKCIYDRQPEVNSIIIECPFSTMVSTVKARFKNMGVPSFPMAQLLVLWGGAQNGFNAFAHNPVRYATRVNCPTLLMCGGKDDKVSVKETETIYEKLAGRKTLVVYENAAHEDYLLDYKREWVRDVMLFLAP